MTPRLTTTHLLIATLAMTVIVFGLGAAIVVVKLRPPASTAIASELQDLRRAADAAPDDDWAQVGLGLAFVDAGKDAEAQAAFEQALQINDQNWAASFQLGLLLTEEDPDRAASLLEKAGKLAPDTSKAGPFIALGDLRLVLGDAEGAKRAFQRAVADVPFIFDAHFGLARALEELGDRDGALQQYREAARYDPQNEEVRQAIARLSSGVGQT